MRALLLLLVFFFLNFTPDKNPPNGEAAENQSTEIFSDIETLYVGDENRGRFLVKPEGMSQQMQFCDLIPGQTYKIFAVKGEQCSPLVSMKGHELGQTFEFVATAACQEFTYHAGMCTEETYVSIGCQTCKKDNSFMEEFMLSVAQASDQSLIEDVFIGGNCFDVTNVSGIGPQEGRGQFSGGSFGLSDGVILSTGNITNATGPNNSGSAGNNMGGPGGDPDLGIYAGGHPTFDTEGIEFDFTPTIPTMDFLFVFASEEYCEWVGSQFNDIFGFFISGPGISGPFSNNGINIGVVPGGATPITINTVNPGQNSSFFIPNDGSCGGMVNPNFQFDGYTSVIVATAAVIPCETYHIKLVCSDVGDGIYDTAVFLGAGSFNAGGTASAEGFSAITGTNTIYEDCPDGGFLFERVGFNLNSLITINITVEPSSTATPGVDYQPLPSVVIIPPGATSFLLPVAVFSDAIIEGAESIILTLDNPCSCTADEVILWIEEPPPVEASLLDEELCGGGAVVLEPSITGGIQNPAIYTYVWSDGSTDPILVAAPSQTTTYSVTVTDFCGSTAEANSTITVYPIALAELDSDVQIVCDASTAETELVISSITPLSSLPVEIVISQDGSPLSPPLVINPGDFPPYTYTVYGTGQFEIFSVTNGNGLCPGIGAGFFQVQEIPMDVEYEATNVSCFGEANGTITVTPLSGVPPFTYLWDIGLPDTVNIATNLPAGVYGITVIDDTDCEFELEAEIEEAPELDAQAVQLTTPDCNNPNGGSAEVLANGGTPIYSYNWSNGDSGSIIADVPSGFYQVTVTDESNCTSEAEVYIDDNMIPPIAVADTEGLIDCLNQTTTVNSDGSSTGGNITYQWSGPGIIGGNNGSTAEVNQPGTYTLVVTDLDNGCTEEDVTIVIQNEDLPTAAIEDPEQVDCDDIEVTLDGSASSTNGNFTYDWNTSDGFIVNGNGTLFPVVNSAGTYNLLVTDEDNGCTAEATIVVPEDFTNPDAEAGPNQLLSCTANTVTLDGTGSTLGINITYNWQTNNGTIVSGGNTLAPEVSEAGLYEIVVTNTDNGCTALDTVVVDLNSDVPIADGGDDQTIDCTASELTLDASNSSSGGTIIFTWTTNGGNFVSGQSTLTPVIDQPGEYILTVTDQANGCEAISTVIVDEDTILPTAQISPPQEINCEFPSITIDGSNSSNNGNYTYTWTTSNGSIVSGGNTLTPEVDAGGTYDLTILNNDSGCEESASVLVPENMDTPDAQIATPDLITCTALEITIDGTNSTGNGPLVYTWTTQDGTIVSGDSTLTPTVNTAGTYDLLITNTASNCTSTASVVVTEDNELPTADAGQSFFIDCSNPQVILDGTVTGNGNLVIQWTTNDGSFVSGSDTANPVVDAGGTYVINVSNPDNGCTASASVVIDEDANIPEAIIANPDILNCDLEEFTLDGSASTAGVNIDIQWTTIDGNIVLGENSLTPTIDAPGTYTLSITDEQNNCQNTASVLVTQDILDPTVQAIGGEITCANPTINLDGTGSSTNGDFTYSWTSLTGIQITNPDSLVASVTEPGSFIFSIINNENGCGSSTTIDITQNIQDPEALAVDPPQITCANDFVVIDGTQSSIGGDFEYSWTSPTGSFVSGQNTLLPNVNAPGTYDLLVTDITNGCTATAQVIVTEDIEYPDADAGAPDIVNCYNPTIILDGSNSSNGPIYGYDWETIDGTIESGDDTVNPEVSAAGTYVIEVTNLLNGCATIDQVVIDQNFDTPTPEAGSTQELSCSVSELTLDASGSTGQNIAYNWTTPTGVFSSPTNVVNPTVTAPGMYFVEVIDMVSGCSQVDSVQITQDDDLPIAIVAPSDTLTCSTTAVVLDGTPSDQGPGITYEWTTPDGNIVSGTDGVTAWVDLPGTYIITVFNSNNNCSSSASVIVNENVAPPISEAGPSMELTCSTTFLSLSGNNSSAGPNFTYLWSVVSNGNIVGGENTPNPVVDASGVYELLVTNTWTGCTSTDQVEVTQSNDVPTASAVSNQPITCSLTQVQLDGTQSSQGPDFAYVWNTVDGVIISGGDTPTPTVGSIGTYQLIVLDLTNGCSSTSNVTVTNDITPPDVEAGNGVQITCANPTLSLNGAGSSTGPNFIYQWTGPGAIIGDDSLTPTINSSGDFTLVVTNILNGCSDNDVVTVTSDMTPPNVVVANPEPITCTELVVTLDGNGSSAGFAFDYEWTTADGNILNGNTTLMPEVDQTGTYILLVTNTINGCTETEQVVVGEDMDLPTADAGDGFVRNCWDDVQALDGTGSSNGPNFLYSWTTSDGDITSGSDTRTPNISSGGTYFLVVTDSDNGCTSTDEVEIIEDAPEAELFLNQPFCFGDEGAISINSVVGGVSPYLYSIDGGQTYETGSFFTNVASGTYDIIVQDANGCEYNETATLVTPAQVDVDVTPEVEISWGDEHQIIALSNVPQNEIANITWTPAFGLSCTDCLNPVANPTETTVYTVTITTEHGCTSKAPILIRVKKERNVYIPNSFSPNGDGTNDVFMIYSDNRSVAKIKSFLVFNRWGETVHEFYDFQPDDPQFGWDGIHRGEIVNAAVFAWFAEIEFIDGSTELYEGDVTLVK